MLLLHVRIGIVHKYLKKVAFINFYHGLDTCSLAVFFLDHIPIKRFSCLAQFPFITLQLCA